MLEMAVVIVLLGLYITMLAGAVFTAIDGILRATAESVRSWQGGHAGGAALHH